MSLSHHDIQSVTESSGLIQSAIARGWMTAPLPPLDNPRREYMREHHRKWRAENKAKGLRSDGKPMKQKRI